MKNEIIKFRTTTRHCTQFLRTCASTFVIFLLTFILFSSCTPSLTDYGYRGGITSTIDATEAPHINTGYAPHMDTGYASPQDFHLYFGRSLFNYPTKHYSTQSGWTEDKSYSYNGDTNDPHIPKGRIIIPHQDNKSCFSYMDQFVNNKADYYFRIKAEAIYDYNGATDQFDKLLFAIAAVPPSENFKGTDCYGLDTIVMTNQPPRVIQFKKEFICHDVPDIAPGKVVTIKYKIKFDPKSKSNCWISSQCKIRRPKK